MKKGKPAKKYSQAARVHDLIRLIEARHGVTIAEMAEETGVDRRTIHRDLAAIHEAGYPLISDWEDGRKVYRFITRFRDVPPITFTLQELVALSFFRTQLHFLDGTPFREDLDAVFRKVSSVLPPRYAAHMERIAEVSVPLLQGRRDYSRVGDGLRSLRDALIYQYRVRLSYQAKGQGRPALYEVDPYTLVFYKGGLYLVGYAHNRRALRTFAAERITAVEVTRDRFEIPDDYRPSERLRDAFGIVEEEPLSVAIRFSPELAHTVRDRIWHPTQQVRMESDGACILSFTAGGRMEIIAWVLSYGAHAEVLSPPDLRAEVARVAAAVAARYVSVGG
ncbi:transcriptional regulator [Geobacter sulfurreducens]|jgi:predicted DNA-binding transcriptional regulator YafY|uniref:Helix-turn-helix transcriptional regulator, putative n=1 Tax=Geobacter sulfurreducens (strain ATCC 51573 / DSM 12127 / PCA) TaxID=243231 RepID=Q74FX9_GEOSL|nr:transcriptional regulator [Geobacter sulfurreducens]AAR33805.1 helix-turn-helix transcriptional regulator, putative [Geobacter sulfurreducens PCA]ADI83322.1 helix-turn-helix transcriptional regulator, putative [Geobacter sulfurreducens KN400]AJY70192.1 transcriptional regulator [Geobacter sulfurreducens]QVW35730.1 transcriptional regulator [Geobacter sulfurreducens]UAC04551.1 transcriptional regulator [Geobacter sulfurreducens]